MRRSAQFLPGTGARVRGAWHACLVAACLLLGHGCMSVDPYEGPQPLGTDEFAASAGGVGPMTLQQSVARALAHSSEMASLAASAEVALEESRVAGDIRNPEIRLGVGSSDTIGTRDAWETGAGAETQSGTGSSRETGSETESGTEARTGTGTEVVSAPGSPNRTYTSTTESQSASRSGSVSESESKSRFTRHSSWVSSDITGGEESSWEESLDIALRVYPPNPWTYSAQRSAAAAEANVTRAELRHAQVELSAEVAFLMSELRYLEEDVMELTGLCELNKEAFRATHEMREKGQVRGEDDMFMLRRYLGVESELTAATRRLEEVRLNLAGLVSVPAGSLEVSTNWPDLGPGPDALSDE